MANEQTSIRSIVDKKTQQTMEEWSSIEGRSQQMHTGILLRRLAAMFRDHPDKLEEIGLMTPHIRVA